MAEPLPDDPYKTLGVTKDCTVNDVKKAYRKLVLTCHPDKTGALPAAMKKETDEQFHRVQQAHDLLTNPHERQRYDDRVQLEELRSELRRDLGKDSVRPGMYKSATFSHKPRTTPNKPPGKSPANPIFEARGPPIYETRVPKGVYDEDVPGTRRDTRGSSRKHEERFEVPSPASSRRTSGRVPDRVPDDVLRNHERREDDGDFYARKSKEKELKAEQKASFMDRKKTRTKTRRNDSETKRQTFLESESDDSEVEQFMKSSPRVSDFRRRPEEPVMSPRDRAARRTQSPSSESSDSRVREAMDHIRKNVESAHEKRPSLSKSRPNRTPPPPPPPPAPTVETPRRSAARRTTSGSTSKASKRNLDIVEPSADFHEDHTFELPRRPKLKDDAPASASPGSPRGIPSSPRAATFQGERPAEKIPAMRRTQTMPLQHAAAMPSPRPTRASGLRHAQTPTAEEEDEDSDSSSAGSPTATPPTRTTFKSTKYRINPSDSDEGGDPRKPRIVTLDPEFTKDARAGRTRREESPRASTFTSRPAHRADVRSPPRRSQTYDAAAPGKSGADKKSSSRHHHSSSTEAGGNRPLLFAEMPPDVAFTPRIGRDDVRFAELRRGSADGVLPSRGEDRREREREDKRESKRASDRDLEREPKRERERDRDRDRERDRERGKDDYAYESKSARRAAGRPDLGRGASYASVHV